MSDSCLFLIKDNTTPVCHEVALYMHWNGKNAIELLELSIDEMRRNDAPMSLARLTGVVTRYFSKTNLSVACFSINPNELCDFFGYDAGILLYDCFSGLLKISKGYLKDDHRNNTVLKTPPLDY